MPAAVFVTYDTMIGCMKSDKKEIEGEPSCYARLATICNYSNQSEHVVRKNINWLVEHGWLIPIEQIGSWGSNRYRVIEHDDHDSVPDECPAYHYDPDTGEEVQGRLMPFGLLWQRIRQLGGFTADGSLRPDVQFGWDTRTGEGYFRVKPGKSPGLVNPGESPGLKSGPTLGAAGSQPWGQREVNPGERPGQSCTYSVAHSVSEPVFGTKDSSSSSEITRKPLLSNSLRPWVRAIWNKKNPGNILGILGEREREGIEQLVEECGEQVAARTWYFYVFDEQPKYHMEPVEHVDSGVSKAGHEWAHTVKDQSTVTVFPVLAFLTTWCQGYVDYAREHSADRQMREIVGEALKESGQ
jgi:hypothetical protein